MNPLLLLVIVPACVLVGMGIMGALVKLDNYDEQKANLLEKQYQEVVKAIEAKEPGPETLWGIFLRHEKEREALGK